MNEEQHQIIEEAASWIIARRLHAPAIFLLEMIRPFTGGIALASQGIAPLLSFLIKPKNLTSFSELMESEAGVTQLIFLLERSQEVCRHG